MKLLSTAVLVMLIASTGCKKENLKPSAQGVSVSGNDNAATAPASSILKYDPLTGNYTLTLQPGVDGNDLWFKYWGDHPYYADTCDTEVNLVKALTWQVMNRRLVTRSIIKFDSLVKVPATAQVIAATLYLYGPSPNSPDVATHLPMGDSYYPGSQYQENTTLIRRVTTAWDASTICWNKQPVTIATDQSILSPSTQQWEYNTSADVTNLIKPMISNPARNFGMMLRLQTESIYRSMGFFSSEYKVAAKRPKLVVVYK